MASFGLGADGCQHKWLKVALMPTSIEPATQRGAGHPTRVLEFHSIPVG